MNAFAFTFSGRVGVRRALDVSRSAVLLLALGCSSPEATEEASDAAVAEIQMQLHQAPWDQLRQLCDQEFEFEHQVDVGNGVRLHVIERFSGRAAVRFPRRAMLMIPPTLATNEVYSADVEGDETYSSLHQLASRGFFGFAMSYEGYGESTRPADGTTVTAERSLQQAGKVVEWIRTNRGVPRVDLFGMSVGAGIASALGGVESPIPRQHINRVVITTQVYASFTEELQAMFTPEFQAFLQSLPNGYLDTTPDFYFPVVSELEPEALAWFFETIPGSYAIGPTLEAFDLPVFQAGEGRAPMLQFYGLRDPVAPLQDAQQFQAEYGGPHQLVVYEQAGHSPALEPVRHDLWDEAERFLNKGTPKSLSLCDLPGLR